MKIKPLYLTLAVLLVGVLSGYALAPVAQRAGGLVQHDEPIFINGLKTGYDGTERISGAGVATFGTTTVSSFTATGAVSLSGAMALTSTLTVGSGGTAINKYKCYTDATFDPAAVASSTADASVAILTPSVIAGDPLIATLDSSTSTNLWTVRANVTAGSGTAGATTTLYLHGLGDSVNLSTTTAKVCIIN